MIFIIMRTFLLYDIISGEMVNFGIIYTLVYHDFSLSRVDYIVNNIIQ
jgi:hypothetical protein